jgi:hypothetical protein
VDAAEPRLEMAPRRAVRCLMEGIAFSKKELADALGATPRTLERWRSDETYPQGDPRRRLAALVELDRHLRDTFGVGAAREWLKQTQSVSPGTDAG